MTILVFAVLILHIFAVPTVIRLCVEADSDKSAARIELRLFRVPIFVKRINLDLTKALSKKSEETETSEEEKTEEKDEKKKKGGFKKYLFRAALNTASRIRVRDMDIDAKIGTGDAAATAFTVGSARIAYGQVCAYYDLPIKTDAITPDYDVTRFFMRFFGIFSLCFADIIVALIGSIR